MSYYFYIFLINNLRNGYQNLIWGQIQKNFKMQKKSTGNFWKKKVQRKFYFIHLHKLLREEKTRGKKMSRTNVLKETIYIIQYKER